MFNYRYIPIQEKLQTLDPKSGTVVKSETIRAEDLKNKPYEVVGDLVCREISQGLTISEVCIGHGWFPTVDVFENWLSKDNELQDKLNYAQKLRLRRLKDTLYTAAHKMAERLADGKLGDDGGKIIDQLGKMLNQLLSIEDKQAKKHVDRYVVFEEILDDDKDSDWVQIS